MKFLDKVGLVIFSMLSLIISIVLVLIGFKFVDASIFSVLVDKVLASQQYTYIMIGVCVMIILLAIRCLFFGQDSNSYGEGILLQNNDGKLLITKTTLENLVEGVVKDFPSINNAITNVDLDRENNIAINIVLDVKEGTVIKDLSSKLQAKVKKEIKDATNLELSSVDIEIQNVDINEETKEDKNKE